MTVTIKDIAKIAKVSHTTVSRALNDSPLINQETKERIKALAKELNYTPNYNAKSLVLDKSYNIGLFFSTINEGTSATFLAEVIREANRVIRDSYNLVIRGIDDYKDFSSINKKKFDGILLLSQSAADNSFIYNVLDKEIPLIVLNREVKDPRVINILADDKKGAYTAGKHLLQQGHRKIAMIEGKQGFKSTELRRLGFLQALAEGNLIVSDQYIADGNYDLEGGYSSMRGIMANRHKPTAVFCFNDEMALGAIKAIKESGLKIPEDISVVGFDDSHFSAFLSPAITTVRRPIDKVTREGANKLMQLIQGDIQMKSETIYFDTKFIYRESTGQNI
ncbi:MAG: LacI family DNA-binding transcriptional regulator [Bacillota bacterium]|nr:LacI family DNA-binding transcriptional regulator [Bacillota bacterium]